MWGALAGVGAHASSDVDLRCGSVEGQLAWSLQRLTEQGREKLSQDGSGQGKVSEQAGWKKRPAPSPRDVLHCHALWILLPPYKSLLEQQKDNAPDSEYFKNINHQFPLKSVLGAGWVRQLAKGASS